MSMAAIWLHHPARLEALEAGVSRFDAGTPCNFGHTGLRYTATAICVECNNGRNLKKRGPKRKPKLTKTEKKTKHVRNIAAGLKRSIPTVVLPKRAAVALWGYSKSNEADARSQYLDSLLRRE